MDCRYGTPHDCHNSQAAKARQEADQQTDTAQEVEQADKVGHAEWLRQPESPRFVTAYTCANPPSTNNSVPGCSCCRRMRKKPPLAISSGVPNLPSGTLSEIIFLRSSPTSAEASRSLSPGVSMEPGLTAFTRMWRSFKSFVQVRANERTAALVAL